MPAMVEAKVFRRCSDGHQWVDKAPRSCEGGTIPGAPGANRLDNPSAEPAVFLDTVGAATADAPAGAASTTPTVV